MRKWTIGVLAVAVSLIFLSVALVIAANFTDASIEPEVRKVLDTQFVANEVQQQAYEFYLGTFAGNLDQAQEAGAEFYRDLSKGGKKWFEAAKGRWWSVDPLPCQLCGADDFKEKQVAERFTKAHEQIRAYIKLVEYRDIKSFKGNDETLLGGPAALPFGMHRYFLLQLSLWLDKKGDERVFDLLQASNQFLFSLMNNGTLLERMMAAIAIVDNARFLAKERERHPKMVVPRDLVESFRMPEADDILFGAMEEEVRAFARGAKMIRSYADIRETAIAEAPILDTLAGWIPIRLAFRPNDAVNRFHKIAMQVAGTDCPAGVEFRQCIPDLEWAEFNSPFDYLVNPLGRIMIRIFAPHENRKFKLIEKRKELSAIRESFHL